MNNGHRNERPSTLKQNLRRGSTTGATLAWRIIGSLGVLVLGSIFPKLADAATQTDWSEGVGGTDIVSMWDGSFERAEGISWLAVPGQITLSGFLLDPPVKHVVSDSFRRPASLEAADVDGDGDLDLIGAAFGGNEIRWWRNEGGQPPTWTAIAIEEGFRAASSVRAGDIDGDGSMDVAGCAWNDDEVAVWFNGGQGVSWTRQSVATGLDQCHWVDLADLDGDGDLDLLGAAARADTVAVWINDGGLPIVWTMQVIDADYGGARSLVPTDLDGDGDVDLLGTALEDDDISWWRNDGGEPLAWTKNNLSSSLDGAHHAGGWDMDLDGDEDIVAAGFAHPWLKLWRSDGGDPVTWTEEEIGGVILTPLVVDVADLDGDGDHDLVATSNDWNRVMWWQNDGGPPGEWEPVVVESHFPNAWPLATADLDDNGSVDVVSGASGGLEVAWWRMTDFVAFGFLESRVLSIPGDVVGVQCLVEAVEPHGTGVSVAIRIGEAPDDLGPWLAVESGRPTMLLARGPVFLQYRIELSTSDATVAPVVSNIAIEWTSELPSRGDSGGRVSP